MRPFLVPDAEFLCTDGPNPLTSDAYADDFNEIREAASDGNPATEPDPNWAPLFDPTVVVLGVLARWNGR